MKSILSPGNPPSESCVGDLYPFLCKDSERHPTPTLGPEDYACLPTYETIKSDGHNPWTMNGGIAGSDFDKAFVELGVDPVLGPATVDYKELGSKPPSPIATDKITSSTCTSQQDTVSPLDTLKYLKNIDLAPVLAWQRDNFVTPTTASQVATVAGVASVISTPVTQVAPVNEVASVAGVASVISTSVTQVAPVNEVASVAYVDPNTGLVQNPVLSSNQTNSATAAPAIGVALVAQTAPVTFIDPDTGVDMGPIVSFNQSNLANATPVAQTVSVAQAAPATATSAAQVAPVAPAFTPGKAKLFSLESTSSRPQPARRPPKNPKQKKKQDDKPHVDEGKRIPSKPPHKAKGNTNQAPVTPHLRNIASATPTIPVPVTIPKAPTVPITPMTGVVGNTIPTTSTMTMTPVEPIRTAGPNASAAPMIPMTGVTGYTIPTTSTMLTTPVKGPNCTAVPNAFAVPTTPVKGPIHPVIPYASSAVSTTPMTGVTGYTIPTTSNMPTTPVKGPNFTAVPNAPTFPTTPVKGPIHPVIPYASSAVSTTPMTGVNGNTMPWAPIAHPNQQQQQQQQQLEIQEQHLRLEWQLLQEQRIHLLRQKPSNDQQLQIYKQQIKLYNEQFMLCKQKIEQHKEQVGQYKCQQEQFQPFQPVGAPSGVYPTPPKERPQAASSLSSGSPGKRKFKFMENVVPHDFVANPNNHARWEPDSKGKQVYMNGPQAKRARVALE